LPCTPSPGILPTTIDIVTQFLQLDSQCVTLSPSLVTRSAQILNALLQSGDAAQQAADLFLSLITRSAQVLNALLQSHHLVNVAAIRVDLRFSALQHVLQPSDLHLTHGQLLEHLSEVSCVLAAHQ